MQLSTSNTCKSFTLTMLLRGHGEGHGGGWAKLGVNRGRGVGEGVVLLLWLLGRGWCAHLPTEQVITILQWLWQGCHGHWWQGVAWCLNWRVL